MNQYIFIFIWVLLFGLLYKPEKQTEGLLYQRKSYYDNSFLYYIMLVLPIILSAAFRTTFGDQGYKISYRACTWSFADLIENIQSGAKGPGYSVIQFLGIKIFGNNAEIFFFVIAALQMYSLIKLYKKYSPNLWVGIFIFVASTDYLSWMQNGIRQFIAVTLIVFFSDWIFQKKYLRICLIILIAATIHTSALIMIPIVFIVQGEAFNRKTLLAIICTVILLSALNQFVPIVDDMLSGTEYSGAITDWQSSNNNGVSFLRVLVYSVPTILAIFGRKMIKTSEDKVIHIVCNMSILSTLLYIIGMFTSGIYVGRLPIYCSLYSNGILLPWLIKKMFDKRSQELIYLIMIISYMLFYYYQTHIIWGLI